MIFQEEYDVLYEDLQKIGEMKQKEIIIAELNNIYQKLKTEDEGNYYNIFRRKVLGSAYKGSDNIIVEKEYPNELKRIFHNNDDSTSEDDIPSNEIREAAKRYFGEKELLESVKEHKKSIEKAAGKIRDSIVKISPSNLMKEYQPIDYEIEYALKQITQLESTRLSKCCNILVFAYTTKINEIKSSIKQDRKVLFNAVKQIIEEG